MPVLIPRTRTLGVRLSEDEYLTFEKFCVESGARSMSDVARTAICAAARQCNQDNALATAVSAHSVRVKELEHRVERLMAEITLLKSREHLKREETPEAGCEPLEEQPSESGI